MCFNEFYCLNNNFKVYYSEVKISKLKFKVVMSLC